MLNSSVTRPAWDSTNLEAYKDQRVLRYGAFEVVKGFFVSSKGFARQRDFAELFPNGKGH